jgi:hypothetical protein
VPTWCKIHLKIKNTFIAPTRHKIHLVLLASEQPLLLECIPLTSQTQKKSQALEPCSQLLVCTTTSYLQYKITLHCTSSESLWVFPPQMRSHSHTVPRGVSSPLKTPCSLFWTPSFPFGTPSYWITPQKHHYYIWMNKAYTVRNNKRDHVAT